MAKNGSCTMDIQALMNLRENLKTRANIEVGVFSGKSARREGGLTNADLAMYHEYGSPEHNLPPRSMLREPIFDHMKEIMAPLRANLQAFITKSGDKKLYDSVGILCLKVVLDAFHTGGFGKWAPLKEETIWRKLRKFKSMSTRLGKFAAIQAGDIGQGILINTAQLRRAFDWRVRMVR